MTTLEQIKYIYNNWNSPDRKPIWKILVGLPLYLLYIPCRKFVDWMDS